jgi:hypothetical protein
MDNNNIWGPPAWTFLHTVSFNYPDNPTDQDKQNYFDFFNSLKHVLPCDKCKKHYKENSTGLKNNLNTKDDLVNWLINIHNDVNKKNGKKIWSYSEVYNKYQNMYNTSNTYNIIILLLIIFIVFIFIFFLINIYHGKKSSCK